MSLRDRFLWPDCYPLIDRVRREHFWWCHACETCLGPESGCDCADRCTCGRLRDIPK